jgi:iron complex transport system substrate-binding protein
LACLSTSSIAFLQRLNSLKYLKGLAYASYTPNTLVKQQLNEGKTHDISGEQEIDIEKLLASGAQLLIAYPSSSLPLDKLQAFGISVVYAPEYNEDSPLAQSEWVKFYGALLGQEEMANNAFIQIVVEYNAVKESILQEEKPLVLYGKLYRGSWSAPGGRSHIAQFISDAGGTYFMQENTEKGAVYLDLEQVYTNGKNAQKWLILATYPETATLMDLTDEDKRYSSLRPFMGKEVYLCNTQTVNYFEDILLEPHIFLKNVAQILHSSQGDTLQLKYFQKLR